MDFLKCHTISLWHSLQGQYCYHLLYLNFRCMVALWELTYFAITIKDPSDIVILDTSRDLFID